MADTQQAPDSGFEATGRKIVAGTWFCALIVMVTSASSAVLTFGALGGNRVVGLGIGVSVDIALCVGLIGDRRLYHHGLTSVWGRALRITTALMSLILNVGQPLHDGNYALAFLHTFPPVLLVVLTEYGQDVLLAFAKLQTSPSRDGSGMSEPRSIPAAPVSPSTETARLNSSAPHPVTPQRGTQTGVPGGSTSILPDRSERNGHRPEPPTQTIPVTPVHPLRPATERPEQARTRTPNTRGGTGIERPGTPSGTAKPGQDENGRAERSDADLLADVAAIAERDGTVPSLNRVKTELGVGSGRARRLLDIHQAGQPVPAAS